MCAHRMHFFYGVRLAFRFVWSTPLAAYITERLLRGNVTMFRPQVMISFRSDGDADPVADILTL
jgi:hypothetical protein